MVKVVYLSLNKYRRKYNDVLRKKLESNGIGYEECSGKYGWNLFVKPEDVNKANRIILSISLTNPKY
jgi:hypothetical protein